MEAVESLAPAVGVAPACRAMGASRAVLYRRRRPPVDKPVRKATRPHPRALSDEERQRVLQILHCEEFIDRSPAAVYAELLDRGTYVCSTRTMYRVLDQESEVRERRDQLRHPQYRKPELLATAPNQVWSWDITKLLGPVKWTYYYLYVILDVYSRSVVGWMLASRESAALAQRLIQETVENQNVVPDELIIHSDRGPAMKSLTVAQLLGGLGVTQSFNRPYVSTDNPYSESQFRTLKYCPGFPKRFQSQEHALSFCRRFFDWYNDHHYHSGIAMLTPHMVHYGHAENVLRHRQTVLDAAYAAHPERFVTKPPTTAELPSAVWINPPSDNGDDRSFCYTNSDQQVSHCH